MKIIVPAGIGRLPATGQMYDAQAFGNGENIVASPVAALTLVRALNKSAGTLYVQFFDATTIPGNGAVPAFMPLALPAGVTTSLDLSTTFGEGAMAGVRFTTGLTWGVSSTAGTFTADASSSVWLFARFFA